MMSFLRLPRRVPAACSPSLKVVSNTATFSDMTFSDMTLSDLTLSDMASLAYPGRVKNPPHLLRGDGKLFRHPRNFAALTLPYFGNHHAREFLRHLLKRLVLEIGRAACRGRGER